MPMLPHHFRSPARGRSPSRCAACGATGSAPLDAAASTSVAPTVMLWDFDLRGEAERYVDQCTGSDHGDPRGTLVRLIAIAGAAIDAMGRLD